MLKNTVKVILIVIIWRILTNEVFFMYCVCFVQKRMFCTKTNQKKNRALALPRPSRQDIAIPIVIHIYQ